MRWVRRQICNPTVSVGPFERLHRRSATSRRSGVFDAILAKALARKPQIATPAPRIRGGLAKGFESRGGESVATEVTSSHDHFISNRVTRLSRPGMGGRAPA